VLLAIAATAWVGVRGWLAKDHLEKAVSLVPRIEQGARQGSSSAATLAALQRETGAARDLTRDPVWSAAQHLPWVGDDLGAVGAAARSADMVSTGAAPPLLALAGALDVTTLQPRGGGIDLKALHEARQELRQADTALKRARALVAPYVGTGERARSLTPPVRQAMSRMAGALSVLGGLADSANRAAGLLPSLGSAAGLPAA
jgi:hypothetical protein